jgi:hypothetical protein
MQITSLLIERAREPFNGLADLLPLHFIHTSEQLDLVEECLRKICTLSKHATHFLSASVVAQITVEADSIIEEKGKFCQFLDEEKKKNHIKYSDRTKRAIKRKFTDFMKRLEDFQQKLPRH